MRVLVSVWQFAHSCLTLCVPMDCSLPSSSVHEDFPGKNAGVGCHASSRGSSQPRDRTQVSHIAGGFFTSWATREAQGYWSGYPVPSPGALPDPGIELGSPALQDDSLPTELSGKPWKWKWKLLSRVRLCTVYGILQARKRVGSLPLLQEIFLTQGSNPGLLHCRWIIYQLSHKGSPIHYQKVCLIHPLLL